MIRFCLIFFILILSTQVAADSKSEKQKCVEAIGVSQLEWTDARNTCNKATKECSDSCAPVRDAEEKKCDVTSAFDIDQCDGDAPCITGARSKHSACLIAARKINFCKTPDCAWQTESCEYAQQKEKEARSLREKGC